MLASELVFFEEDDLGPMVVVRVVRDTDED